MNTYYKGLFFEFLAIVILLLKGYYVLAKRFKTKAGEIDIICCKGDLLVCVEVKYRGRIAQAALREGQAKRIVNAARVFKSIAFVRGQVRFDYLCFGPWPIHKKNAFC